MTYRGTLSRLAALLAVWMLLVTASCALWTMETADPGPSLPRRTRPPQ